MPFIKEKYYNDVLWEAADILVSLEVRKILDKRGYQDLIMSKERWNKCVARTYRSLVRNYNRQLKLHGTSISKVKITKRIKPEGGFTIVFEGK